MSTLTRVKTHALWSMKSGRWRSLSSSSPLKTRRKRTYQKWREWRPALPLPNESLTFGLPFPNSRLYTRAQSRIQSLVYCNKTSWSSNRPCWKQRIVCRCSKDCRLHQLQWHWITVLTRDSIASMAPFWTLHLRLRFTTFRAPSTTACAERNIRSLKERIVEQEFRRQSTEKSS